MSINGGLMEKINAYKVFNPDMTCRGFQYEVGKEYEAKGDILICENGFHACEKLADCFNYYRFDPSNKIAEVVLSGTIIKENDKLCAQKIKIKKLISWETALTLCNSGNSNSGLSNSGHCNSGDSNSGNWNSGDSNSGDSNSGHSNSGDSNSGNSNSGDSNSGDSNSGHCNSGHWNSGDSNSGNWNSGDYNSGNWNSGNWNSGHCNSGNWNSGNRNSGHLNSNEPDKIRIFNKYTDRTEFEFPEYFYFDLTEFVSHDTATPEEKEIYKKEIEVCGGFLRTLDYKQAWQKSYNKASDEDKAKTKKLPNFDSDIFFEITGIKID